mmetsp:Transcript_19078/g.64437  ORF Transcript_19078/g.64437 Transcript_19078/m.64437 type:complete len:232 (+) Transcript_19078:757-1452(+)
MEASSRRSNAPGLLRISSLIRCRIRIIRRPSEVRGERHLADLLQDGVHRLIFGNVEPHKGFDAVLFAFLNPLANHALHSQGNARRHVQDVALFGRGAPDHGQPSLTICLGRDCICGVRRVALCGRIQEHHFKRFQRRAVQLGGDAAVDDSRFVDDEDCVLWERVDQVSIEAVVLQHPVCRPVQQLRRTARRRGVPRDALVRKVVIQLLHVQRRPPLHGLQRRVDGDCRLDV